MAERTKLNGTSVKLNSTETSKDALGESVSQIMATSFKAVLEAILYMYNSLL